jgi:hypothetical protein
MLWHDRARQNVCIYEEEAGLRPLFLFLASIYVRLKSQHERYEALVYANYHDCFCFMNMCSVWG